MAKHLLDSDILIWILRGKPEAVSFVTDLLRNEVPSISSLSVYEIWIGARTREEDAIDNFLSSFQVLKVDAAIARKGAQYYQQFRSKGMTLSSTDALIAATAQTYALTLVTQNKRHFPMSDIRIQSVQFGL